LSATVLAACAPAAPAANGDGPLTIYTSRSEALFKPVIEAFNKKYPGIKVESLSGDNGALLAKIREEGAKPRADVYVNSDTLTMLTNLDMFQPNADVTKRVPAQYRAEDGRWVALTLRPRVLMYNTTLVKPDELPKSIFELADPKWKGQVSSTNSASGAMMANLVALRKLHGDAKVTALIKGLVANGTQWAGSSHTNVRNAVGRGEAKLGWVNHYYYYLSKAEGQPVGLHYVDEDQGLIVNSTNAGIINGAANTARARLFVDFMLSEEGQRIFAEKNYEYPIVPGVALAAGVEPLGARKLSSVNLIDLASDLAPTKALAQAAGLP
jgi:iron(III) transport system substrate-binding protein